jgi:hypothetical protein
MKHFSRTSTHQPTQSRRTTHALALSCWQIFVITTCLWLGLVSEGLASHAVSPTSLTFYAVQGATNPPKKTLTFSKVQTFSATLTASDNATWLTVSPASQTVTTRGVLTVTVNTSGRAAGTYKATITVKEGTWYTRLIPVTLIISPAGGGGGGTTSSATLTWNAVTGTTVSGYKVYVGEAPNQYTRTITVGNVTSSTVSSLTVGRMYYFVVTAYNSAGESTPSNMVSRTIQ